MRRRLRPFTIEGENRRKFCRKYSSSMGYLQRSSGILPHGPFHALREYFLESAELQEKVKKRLVLIYHTEGTQAKQDYSSGPFIYDEEKISRKVELPVLRELEKLQGH
jgi:hypothetical protein